MLSIKHDVLVAKEGSKDCANHLWMHQKGKLYIGDRKRVQERVCTKCGRYEIVTTTLVKKSFDFNQVLDHFHGDN